MENIQNRIGKGINILKKKYSLFLAVCLGSSITSVYFVPFIVKKMITEQDVNEALVWVYKVTNTTLIFSASEMILSIIMLIQLLTFLLTIIIVAYIVKHVIDKKMFRINKWRDWRFFSYALGIAFIGTDIFQKIIFNNSNDIIINLLLTISSCFVIVILSSIILPEELPEIRIQ